jgi:hypothetical protein
MNCESCVNKLRPFLDGDPNITKWEADLKSPKKLLTLELRDNSQKDLIRDRIKAAGFDATLVQGNHRNEILDEQKLSEKPFKLENYRPLLLVVAYVIGASALMEYQKSEWAWMRFMNNFMGVFFLAFAFFKLLDIQKFADAFSTYDVIARRFRIYGLSYPWIELGLGLLFVSRTGLLLANLTTLVVMSVGMIGVAKAIRKKQAIQCACLGTVFNLPMSVVTVIENGVMIAMSASMLLLNFRIA